MRNIAYCVLSFLLVGSVSMFAKQTDNVAALKKLDDIIIKGDLSDSERKEIRRLEIAIGAIQMPLRQISSIRFLI